MAFMAFSFMAFMAFSLMAFMGFMVAPFMVFIWLLLFMAMAIQHSLEAAWGDWWQRLATLGTERPRLAIVVPLITTWLSLLLNKHW